MNRKLIALLILCSLGLFLAGCDLSKLQTFKGDVIPLAENTNLSLDISKGWQGTITQGNTESNPPYAIPLQLEIKNNSSKNLSRVRPRMNGQGEMQYGPSIIVSCVDDEGDLNYIQNIFQLFPGLIEAGSGRAYTPKVVSNTNWGSTTIGGDANIVIDSRGRTPRFTHASNMQEGEEVAGSINLNCKLFISKRAGVNDCDCHVDEDRNLTDYNCFGSCYPEISTQDQDYFNVDYYNPSDNRIESDQASIEINYEGIVTKCDFGCDIEYEFSI